MGNKISTILFTLTGVAALIAAVFVASWALRPTPCYDPDAGVVRNVDKNHIYLPMFGYVAEYDEHGTERKVPLCSESPVRQHASANTSESRAVQEQGTFTDTRDSKVYKTVNLGNQTWMAENLTYESDDSWCNKCEIYGRLYTWEAAKRGCPSGWHLPSDAEWQTLVDYLGGDNLAGGKLKSPGAWNDPNTGATDSSGFSGLPAGGRSNNGNFLLLGSLGSWWSSTERSTNAWARNLGYNTAEVYRDYKVKDYAFSVRCAKDR